MKSEAVVVRECITAVFCIFFSDTKIMSTDFILLTAGDIRHGQFLLPLTLLCHQQDIRLD